MPGTRKNTRISGTIDFISGAEPTASRPASPFGASAGARHAESAGSVLSRNSAPTTSIATTAITRPRVSRASILAIGAGSSAGSASIGVFARRRGSITRSVRIQPTAMTSSEDAVVK